MNRWLLWGCVLVVGCGNREATVRREALVSPPPVAEPAGTVVFEGSCDASGAVELGGDLFMVADDEDNILRLYDARKGGRPLKTVDLSPSLELPVKKKPPETDIEAGSRLGNLAFWLTSHGRNSSGKKQPARLRFFATNASDAEHVQLIGQPYTQLLEDLLAEPRLAPYGLVDAEPLPPKQAGGLNIEGLTAMLDAPGMLIGFRSPLTQGKALVVPLLNPEAVVREGVSARFGAPRLLDLGGLGIRSLSSWRGRYLITAGATGSEARSRLFTWKGGDDRPVPVESVDLSRLNPEAFFTPDTSDEVLLLSDDGTVSLDGVECKRQKDPALKRFRGVWTALPQSP
ncbi:DUF3616 domain-containing protein [Corallococcus terminator]|uniref:DUF3616 domain-containing protein n=1 Tax=Corallococcus terminator TaxID=2316733 RepID=A0A3A8IWD8_9BACT|nr:DUF3616 domain-containing protein [Corallococcus terminator]RKG87672.1 DUF3616 domain-containing protein [Corallococcus terminator]